MTAIETTRTIDVCVNASCQVGGPEVFWMSRWDEWVELVFPVFAMRSAGHCVLLNPGLPADFAALADAWEAYLGGPQGRPVRGPGQDIEPHMSREHPMDAGAVDNVQPDLHRCGGFTEGRRTAAMAADRGLPIVCHTYSVPHLHFSVATENCPILEHFPQPCWFELPGPPLPFSLMNRPSSTDRPPPPASRVWGFGWTASDCTH